MASEQETSGDGAGVATAERRQGHALQSPTTAPAELRARDHRRDHPGDGPAPDQGLRGRLRADVLRPGVHQHGLVPLGDHLHRRRRGHPPAPRHPDRAALRALDLPRGRLPARLRRAADRSRSSSAGSTTSPITPSSTRTSRSSSRASATTPTRWACCSPAVGALSTFYPDAKHIDDPEERYMAAIRLIAKMPTLAAFAYRHNLGLPYVYPDNDLNYSENFLSMMFKMTEVKYEPDPRLAKALDVLFILHADHEQNCSTNAVRSVGSSQVDPYSAVAAGVAALYGPLHGGANEAVLRMLRRIETHREHPRLPRGRQEPRGEADGLRPPRLQELRPAGADHQEARRRGARGDRARTRCSRSRPSSRSRRSTTSSSPSASSTRTSTSTRA